MKKSKNVIGKIIFIIMVMITISVLIGGSPPEINASSEGVVRNRNSHLMNENIELKREYSELIEKLEEMEKLTEKIYEHDNILYAQVKASSLSS